MGATVVGWLMLAAVLILAAEAGYRVHRWARARTKADPDDEDTGSGYVLSAALALLGLLIAFVFGMAADRYEGRRQLVLAEANAISTAVLRYDLLPEPHRTALIKTMADYVKVRRDFFDEGADMEKVRAAEDRTDAMQAVIWQESGAAVRTPEGAPLVNLVLNATNEMFDLATSRHAALDARVPARALHVLILYAVVAAAIMGHGLAPGGRRYLISTSGLFVLVALAISLIIDLDSPRVGSVRVPQGPMVHVAEQVAEMAATLSSSSPIGGGGSTR